ncbi:hypothetical protein OAK75_11120 [Bacteriovoracales bacterium]|nr:hypothetical protein [Bacteriovoracales bacterium]
MDNKDLESFTEEWVKDILEDIIPKDDDVLEAKDISEILNKTLGSLKDTSFCYLNEEEASKVFGQEFKEYLKSKGLPCVDIPGVSGFRYMKQVLNSQFKMREGLMNGSAKPNVIRLTDYVYYSMTAHFLAKMV